MDIVFSESGIPLLINNNINNVFLFDKDFTLGDIREINNNLKLPNKIRIWSSKSMIKDYLSFLYFCYIHEGDISVVFVDEHDKSLYTIGAAKLAEIVKLLKHEKQLSKQEKDRYAYEWKNLQEENSELRLFKNNKVISVSFSYIEDYIKKHYDNSKSESQNFGALLANDDDNHITYNVYRELVGKIIN